MQLGDSDDNDSHRNEHATMNVNNLNNSLSSSSGSSSSSDSSDTTDFSSDSSSSNSSSSSLSSESSYSNSSVASQTSLLCDQQTSNVHQRMMSPKCTVQPYVAKMERFELFSTAQCYYLIASDKAGTTFRVLKFDRTLIEIPNNDNTCRNSNSSSSSSANHNASMDLGARGEVGGGGNVFRMNNFKDNNNSISRMESQSGSPDQSRQDSAGVEGMMGQGQDPSTAAMNDENNNNNNKQTKMRSLSKFCTEDPNVYSATEIRNMLDMIHDGNKKDSLQKNNGNTHGSSGGDDYNQKLGSNTDGGLKPLVKAHGIVGFIRFTNCYLLTLITKKSKVGSIEGNDIYTIKSTETFPIKPAEGNNTIGNGKDPHSVLLNMWNRGKRSLNLGLTNRELAELHYQGIFQVVDLEKDFFFSYTYDLTRSLQQNVLTMASKSFPPPPFKNQYAWNYFQTRELEEITGTISSFYWVLPIINGAFIQKKLHDYGKTLNLTLLARRSRHFAGTRYLKRGISDVGKVANDVEHEQIIHDETPGADGVFSSFLQVRGSIPVYWTQESSVTMPKPPIVLNRVDPAYHATQLHFEDLIQRYGCPILVLDLVKQSEKREREVIVGNEYRHAIDFINQTIDDEHKIRYCALDYSHISKHRNLNVSSSLHDVATWAVNQTGFFCSAPRWKIIEDSQVVPFNESGGDIEKAGRIYFHLGVPVLPMEQKGVLRTNCIDCLDRTNVAQFSAGVESLGQQLVVMGIRNAPKLSSNSNIVKMLIDMYVEIGDQIALQYGGSEAHKKGPITESNAATGGKHKELLTSIRRYYSNTFTDQLRQAGMNLFLGHFIPSKENVNLWEIESDIYMHNQHVKSGPKPLEHMSHFAKTFSIIANDSIPFKYNKRNQEPVRISKVRHKLKAQNDAMSVWWKTAIQIYIQQRMWTQLCRGPEDLLPDRFERNYPPDKLLQFDKILTRTWQKPVVRISHSSQHYVTASEEEKESLITHRKSVHAENLEMRKGRDNSDCNSMINDQFSPLEKYLSKHGYTSFNDPYLKRYLELGQWKSTREVTENIGTSSNRSLCDEYLEYVHPENTKPYSKRYNPDKIREFKSCLRVCSLQSDDVDGVLKLSQSAHINNEIISGPYCGLSQHESAIEVTTMVQEQFNSLETMKNRGILPNSVLPGVNEELRKRSLDTIGVMDAVHQGWKRWSYTEDSYAELLNLTLSHRRSDLTDSNSMKLYCSFFDQTTPLTNLDMNMISGGKEKLDNRVPVEKTNNHETRRAGSRREVLNMQKESLMGIRSKFDIKSHSQFLFPLEVKKKFPNGYEQINDDLFARKDNRFMVFNGVGVENKWPPKPKSKMSSQSLVEDITIAADLGN